jgi:predicted DNA-binding protein with PD1-like motif
MVVEIFIMEIEGIDATRQFDATKGFAPIVFAKK